MKEWKKEWKNERMKEWKNERMKEWKNERWKKAWKSAERWENVIVIN